MKNLDDFVEELPKMSDEDADECICGLIVGIIEEVLKSPQEILDENGKVKDGKVDELSEKVLTDME